MSSNHLSRPSRESRSLGEFRRDLRRDLRRGLAVGALALTGALAAPALEAAPAERAAKKVSYSFGDLFCDFFGLCPDLFFDQENLDEENSRNNGFVPVVHRSETDSEIEIEPRNPLPPPPPPGFGRAIEK